MICQETFSINTVSYQVEFKQDPDKLFFKTYNFYIWFENEDSSDKEISTDKEESTNLPPMPTLDGDAVMEGKGYTFQLNSKRTINQSCNIISTNKIQKQFIQVKN